MLTYSYSLYPIRNNARGKKKRTTVPFKIHNIATQKHNKYVPFETEQDENKPLVSVHNTVNWRLTDMKAVTLLQLSDVRFRVMWHAS